MKLSEKLQKIRKENNITQEQLADKLNVSRQAVSKWESGSAFPDTEKLIQISELFNVSLDELIKDTPKDNNLSKEKKISFMEFIDDGINFVMKSFNMFWAMKFSEKIKCLFEIGMIVLIIIGIALVSTSIIVDLIRRILVFLPGDFVYIVCSLFDSLLFLVWMILGIIIVIKIFKSRYLDYYVFITDTNVTKKTIEEPIKELKEKKEYKVVIRDPKDSSLNLVKKIGNIFMIFIKGFGILMGIPLVLFFIFCMIVLVFSLFYLFSGLFFNGISIAILGVLLFIYIIIELVYNLIFNREHAVNRIFILFIGSISLAGIGLGLSFASFTTFTYFDDQEMLVSSHKIEMDNDLVFDEIICLDKSKIIIDNSIDYIKVDVKSYPGSDIYIYKYVSRRYKEEMYGERNIYSYNEVNISSSYNEFDVYKKIISDLEDKKISNFNYGYYEIDKIYISEDNLTKLRNNYNKLYE